MHPTTTETETPPTGAPGSDAWFEARAAMRKMDLDLDQFDRLYQLSEAVGVDDDELSARARWTLVWLAGPEAMVAWKGVLELLEAARHAGRPVVAEIINCPCGETIAARQLERHLMSSARHNDPDGGVA